MNTAKKRLDQVLVERGLFDTRAKASAAIMAGQVLVDGKQAPKAGAPTAEDADIELLSPCPFVSRGGLKLAAALDHFQISPQSRICLDLGASTGGFTDCLLQRGASKVYAVDVGRAQLDDKLKKDPRVKSLEETHARDIKPSWFELRPDLGVVDCSFISLTQVLPPLISCLKAPFEVLALVKPQFEVGPKLAPKGVVREDSARRAAIDKVRAALASLPVREVGLFESPVRGPKGNVEFFLYLKSAST